jgi:hypothetical protein
MEIGLGTDVINGDGMNDGRILIIAAMTTNSTINGGRRDLAGSTTCEATVITAGEPGHGVILFSEAVIVDDAIEQPNRRKPALKTQALLFIEAVRQIAKPNKHPRAVLQPLPKSSRSVINSSLPPRRTNRSIT